ncbi:MtrAB system histidine kinase MtrB [Speluncibacter jeojiensis]|uniref:Sensor histidine kinase MtrB n=1 Tax=Speluncibacter jeojiensis TaxID=2710754 RepID=A0A9X4LV55_9ACTN|nr:MtrAB system histidine kinase MtrB [Corynebacteriales bacterium D3-21]
MHKSRRRLNGAFSPVLRWFRGFGRFLARRWRRSLQFRVVVSTLTLSLIVILILGFVLSSQITDRMLETKVGAATEEIDRARGTVERVLANSDESTSTESRLEVAKAALIDPSAESQSSGGAGAFDPVLVASSSAPGRSTSAGPVGEIPKTLRSFVQAGQVSYQYSSVPGPDGAMMPALIVGTPVSSNITGAELYLVFPLGAEERSLSLMRGILLTGGVVLLGLLAAISMLVARQVVLPVRSASRIAERFADGRLKERMPVRGEDDMARLAMSFNDMAESLSRQITQLEEYGNLQKRFTSDVSHELRTPLTTVRMAADIIHDGSPGLDPTLRRSAELLVTELDRFESLLGDLLEISRHDAGVAELAAEQLDLRVCARAAVSTVRRLAEETGTELVVDLPDEAVVAEADPRRVERVLRNLLANAIDHGESRPVLLRMRADDDAVAVVVRDQGIGLRPGEEKLVFNRFWRSDPSRVRRSGGTGLGLAISVEDARLHQGRLEASGEPGKGACFRLTLPRHHGHKLTGSPLPLRSTAPAKSDRPAPPVPQEPRVEREPSA